MNAEEPRFPIVRDAATRLAAQLDRSGSELNLPEPDVLIGELETVTRMVERAARGDTLSRTSEEEPSLLALRFVDLLRAEVLRGEPEADDLLSLMRAFEAVRVHLCPEGPHLIGSPVLDPWARRLLGEMAHTLGSSMGPMVMLTEVLASGESGAVSELQSNQLRILYRAALASGGMAVDLLRLGGPFEEPEESTPAEFRVEDILEGVADILGPLMEEREVATEVGMEDETGDPYPRVGRPFALRRALVGLSLASMTHARGGTFQLRARADGENVRFLVERQSAEEGEEPSAATGPVFRERFQKRGWHVSPPALGVAAARHLISFLGGDLEVEEMPEGGLRFTFSVVLPPRED